MSITPLQIKQNTVIKIANVKNSILIERQFKIGQQMEWLKVVKISGESAPDVAEMNNNGVRIFKLDPTAERIESTDLVDVYVMCNDGGAPGEYGKLVIWTDYQTTLNPNGGIDINIQDQTTPAFDAHLVQLDGNSTTLAVQSDPEDTELTLVDSTGFIDKSNLGINSTTGEFYFGGQVGAAVDDVIQIDTPIDGTFPVGSVLFGLTRNMAVNGAVTTQVFKFGPGGGTFVIDITRMSGYMQDGTAMDDGKFGGIAALTYGLVLRVNRNGVIENKWNAKTNGELALICASDFNYTIKPPAGTSYGARFRNTYAGPEKHGVAIRLEVGEFIEILVQDDLSDLEVLHIMAQGHIVD